jgi:hypothetical protein
VKRTLLAAVILLSCGSSRNERPADTQAALGGAIAARVGGEAIPLSVVEAVANAQHLSAKDAARKVIDDEIAANSARKKGLDGKNPLAWNLTAVRGRIVADRLLADAKRAGPPSDAEVERLSQLHWADVDRPPMVRVIHAIALRPKNAASADAAKQVAEGLRAAVANASSAEDFEAKAKAVPHPKEVDTRVESLPPFTAEGLVPGGGSMDETFAKAAFALPAVGAQSGIVETSFGWHVIRLVEKVPEQRMPFEDRRKAFAEEVIAMRGHDAATALTKALEAKTKIEVSTAAEALMRSVPIAAEQAANP